MTTGNQILDAMVAIGIRAEDFAFESEHALSELKARARKGLRKLARTHHPDTTECSEQTDLFRVAAEVVQDIEKTEYVQPRRRVRYSFTVTR